MMVCVYIYIYIFNIDMNGLYCSKYYSIYEWFYIQYILQFISTNSYVGSSLVPFMLKSSPALWQGFAWWTSKSWLLGLGAGSKIVDMMRYEDYEPLTLICIYICIYTLYIYIYRLILNTMQCVYLEILSAVLYISTTICRSGSFAMWNEYIRCCFLSLKWWNIRMRYDDPTKA